MPFTPKRLNVLTNNRTFAFLALGGSSLSTFGLAVETPCISILLDMGHPFLEGIAAFSAEEMAIMPVLTKSDGMFTNNRGFAVFAFWSVGFVPVKVTKEAESVIAILCGCLTFYLGEDLASSASSNSLNTLSPLGWWFGMNFERFKACSTGKADKTFGMEVFWCSAKFHNPPLDG
jgi:hypothetical protein